jgi:hypothetical protein
MSAESLLNRIRGEFREMPGLRLTMTQACKSWQPDPLTCETALLRLVREQFLARRQEDTFVALADAPAVALGTPLRRLA